MSAGMAAVGVAVLLWGRGQGRVSRAGMAAVGVVLRSKRREEVGLSRERGKADVPIALHVRTVTT